MQKGSSKLGCLARTLALATAAVLSPFSNSALAADAPATEKRASAGASTQDAAASRQDEHATRRDELIAQLDELGSKRQTLLAEVNRAEGDQREAARLQVRDVEKDLRRVLTELSKLVGELRVAGQEDDSLRRRVHTATRAESGILRADIEAQRAEIESLRKNQDNLKSSELVARKDRIAKQHAYVDGLLGDLYENAERAQRLGLDAAADLAFLDKVLDARATTVAGEIRLTDEQLATQRNQLGKADGGEKDKLQSQVGALQTEKDGATASLAKLVALMKKRGLDDTVYSELLIRSTGQISADTLSAEVARSFLAHQIADAEKWLRERAPAMLFRLLVVIAILFAFYLLAKLVRAGVRAAVRRPHLDVSQLMQTFAIRASGVVVILVGVLVALSQLHIEVSHMLAGLGIAGFVVGFALQDVLANFACGIMILVYRPYDVGDWIEVPDAFGKVQEMNLVSTTVLTGDNQKLLVPNRKIWGSVIRNITAEKTRRVDLTFGIGYADDIAQAERILREIVATDERVLPEPEPLIRMTELGESSVNFILRAWCRTEDYWELRWHITRRVKERFDEEGVTIPFPQRDVHLHAAAPLAVAQAR